MGRKLIQGKTPMDSQGVFEVLGRYGVIPVIAVEDPNSVLPLAEALVRGGLPVAEITFRTTAAAAAISLLKRERPDLIVGAGTVLTGENVVAAKACGAEFAVAPGLNPAVVRKAKEIGLPFAPGVATPTDIEQGLAMGCAVLKVFPAGVLGGPALVKVLSGPYAHTGVRFLPTGGVNAENLETYLRMKTVLAVGGTWIAPADDIVHARWDAIAQRCLEATEIVARARR